MRLSFALATALACASCLVAVERASAQATADPPAKVDRAANPWGVSSSAGAFRNHAEWFPRVASAGVRWVRLFPEWNGLERRPGEWSFDATDAMIREAAKHGIEINAILMGSAPWKNGKAHAFPMNDLDAWSNFVERTVTRYKNDVHYWEVWNEGNGGFNDDRHTTEDYARLVAATYRAAKKADPHAKIGLTVASYDPAYLAQTIVALKRQNAADSFDYLCVHPYEIADGLRDRDGEIPFLWMTHRLRAILAAHAPARADGEIWITEVGRKLAERDENPASERESAEALVKLYAMALAQGIARVQWFEAQDPPSEESGFGLIARDGRPRASYEALSRLSEVLGPNPRYLGWVAPGPRRRGYGFVFQGRERPLLVAWRPRGSECEVVLPADAPPAIDAVSGEVVPYDDGREWELTDAPQLLVDPPAEIVELARSQKDQPFPWGGDHSRATSVSFRLGYELDDEEEDDAAEDEPDGAGDDEIDADDEPRLVGVGGVFQQNERSTARIVFPDGTRGLFVRPNQGTSFWVHPSFADFDDREFYVRVTVRRIDSGNIGMNLFYEIADTQGRTPYKNVGTWFGLAAGDGWRTHTWRVTDAHFAKMWGFDFSFRPEQSGAFAIGKVEVSKTPFAK